MARRKVNTPDTFRPGDVRSIPQRRRSPRDMLAMRIALGVVMILAGLAAAWWSWELAGVEYVYRTTLANPPVSVENMNQRQALEYRRQLRELLVRDSSNGEIRNRLASVLGKIGDHRGAIKELQDAQQTSNAQNARFFLADQYEKLGMHEDARRAMADCVLINPTNTEFMPAYLRLLNRDLLQRIAETGLPGAHAFTEADDLEVYRRFADAAMDWAVRAPHDANSHLFIAQHYVGQQQYLQAYRSYLLGLSRPSWMWLNERSMIEPQDAMTTIQQILRGNYARPYKGLP